MLSEIELIQRKLEQAVSEKNQVELAYQRKIAELNKQLESARFSLKAVRKREKVLKHIIRKEISIPAHNILENAYLLNNAGLDVHQRDNIDAILSAANYLQNSLQNVDYASRLNAGDIQVRQRNFEFITLVRSQEKTFEIRLGSKPVKIHLELDSYVENAVIGDDRLIDQILYNLISNAEKFTSEGTIFIRVKLLNVIEDIHSVLLEVEDTGVGIEPTQMESIKSFFEAPVGKVKLEEPGIGLGLAIVKNLVALLGARVRFKSLVGEGSTFSVFLDLKIRPSVQPVETQESENVELSDNAENMETSDLQLQRSQSDSGGAEQIVEGIDRRYLNSNTVDKETLLEDHELFLETVPNALNSLRHSERISEVANLSSELKGIFQKVGLTKASHDLSALEAYTKEANLDRLNEELEIFLTKADSYVEIVQGEFDRLKA